MSISIINFSPSQNLIIVQIYGALTCLKSAEQKEIQKGTGSKHISLILESNDTDLCLKGI